MTGTAKQNEIKVIIFKSFDKEYAIEVSAIQSIERVISITRVPNTPSYVKGVINLRGVVTPVIELRARLGLPSKEVTSSTRIIIASLDNYDVGLLVDSANDVLDIPVGSIEQQSEVFGTEKSDFISGVTKVNNRLFVMLDLHKVLEPIKWIETV